MVSVLAKGWLANMRTNRLEWNNFYFYSRKLWNGIRVWGKEFKLSFNTSGKWNGLLRWNRRDDDSFGLLFVSLKWIWLLTARYSLCKSSSMVNRRSDVTTKARTRERSTNTSSWNEQLIHRYCSALSSVCSTRAWIKDRALRGDRFRNRKTRARETREDADQKRIQKRIANWFSRIWALVAKSCLLVLRFRIHFRNRDGHSNRLIIRCVQILFDFFASFCSNSG